MVPTESTTLLPPPTRTQDPDPLDLTPANRAGILAGIWTATFLASINTTLVATLLTSISSEYDSANEASWLGTSYLLATATFTPLYGRLSNVLGRRGANQLAVAMLFVAGCGGGGIFTTASIITSDLYDMRSRSLTQGIASIFSGLGMGIGGPLGGWLSDRYGWRSSFLIQVPIFFVSFGLTQSYLRYHVPGKTRTPLQILLRIDYLGSLSLFALVLSSLLGLSLRYNQDVPWSDARVVGCVAGTIGGGIVFLVVEACVAVEPVMAPWMLRKRVPLLVGVSSLLVPMCNFAVMYFFPLLFELVLAKSSTEAGAHLMPNSVSMSLGSLFAGFMMHRTGKYKTLNVVFGILPFLATLLIIRLGPESGFFTQWLSIIPLGFGNAVVLQTTLIALLVSIDHSHVAVGTGFVQLFRGVGQVAGVAIPSALFQRKLKTELGLRITGPGSAELISQIRHNSRVVSTLPPAVQAQAREAFSASLRAVFVFAAVATLLAFIVRLGIPEQSLDSSPSGASDEPMTTDDEVDRLEDDVSDTSSIRTAIAVPVSDAPAPDVVPLPSPRSQRIPPRRRLSTYESDDGHDPDPPMSWRSSTGSRRALSRQSSFAVGSWSTGAGASAVVVREEEEEGRD